MIDGGNSYYKDTEKRYQDFKKKGIKFGHGAEELLQKKGYPMMVGGDKSLRVHKTIFDALANQTEDLKFLEKGEQTLYQNGSQCYRIRNNAIIVRILGWKYHDLLKVSKFYQKGTLVRI